MKIFLLTFSLLVCGYAFSQETVSDTASIPAVIVRSTPLRDTLKNIPASVAVINAELLSQNDGTIITSIVNQTPGVYMQQGALNTNRISIRGIGARSQYSTNRVKAYIDGIPISTAAGSTVLEDIDMDVLESVEIIKGPASSIYGTGLGGVINLYTDEPVRHTASLGATFGSFGLQKYSLMGGFSGQKSSFRVTYNQLESEGYRDNANYERKSLAMNGKIGLGERTSIALLAILTRVKGYIPSSLSRSAFSESPESAAANWDAAEGYESYDRLIAGISLEHRFSEKLSNTTSLFTQGRDAYEPRPFDVLTEDRAGAGARTQFNLDYTLLGCAAELAFGGEALFEDYRGATFENRYMEFPEDGSVQGEKLSENSQLRQNINGFAQQRLVLSERWTVEAGINFNSTSYALNDEMATDSTDQSGSYRYGTVGSPRIAALYKFAPEKVLYATVSHGFSAPGVEETLTPSGEVNTELLPETGINYEMGLKAEWFGGNLSTEVALYTIQIENLLVAERIGPDQFIGINAGKTSHTGAELTLMVRKVIGSSWLVKPYINGSYHHYRFTDFTDDGQEFSGNSLTGVPTHTANIGFQILNTYGFRFRANLLHTGEIPLNDANTAFANGYALLNIQASYELAVGKKVEVRLEAGINNLLDERYAASVLPNAIGFGGSEPRYFYPGDPRNGYVGVFLEI
ncbi:MAG TPA: TonB-dependent receptor [Cryomorphaceae bacterium]|nr:TonB-dependent receptor [Cryomorphaceae bacterium]